MKILIPLLLSLLSGCATYDAYRDVARSKIGEGYDRMIATCKRVKCEDVSVAAWDREYGNDPELANAWRVECRRPNPEMPTK